jgi:peptidoglycan/LPS O-acetylase OafA/YrhL
MRGIAAIVVAYFHCRLIAWIAEREVRGVRFPRWPVTVVSPLLLVLAFTPFLEVLLHARPSRTIPMRMLEKVGAFSYSLYIVHLPVPFALAAWRLHSVKQVSILWSIGLFFAALAAAYVFHLLIERPAIGILRRVSTQPKTTTGKLGAT